MNIRKFIRSKIVPLAFVATCTVAMGAIAQAQTVSELIDKGKVKIGVISGLPPFGSIDAKGTPVGYDIDVANLVGKYMGLPVEVVPLTPPARIPALESGKVDFLVATLAPTPERAKSVMFTMPYNGFELAIVAPTGTPYKTLADLDDKRVGVARGTTQDSALSRVASDSTELVRFEDDATTTQALLSNQIDAIAIPSVLAIEIAKTRGEGKIEMKFPFSVQPNSMTVRKGAFDLQRWLNNFIYYVKLNGELDAISQKWAGTPLPNLPVF